MDAVRNGNVSGMAPVMELDLAELLSDLIPVAEQVMFFKTGAEAAAAAVRVARASTARNHVIGSGYFGWLDWCSSQPGVPGGVSADFSAVPFNDMGALRQAAAGIGGDLAAIIIEPVVDVLAAEAWVRDAREICDEAGAVLIFDEVKTGFRLRIGGYQELTGIQPDLAVFGKAMSNGFPLSALGGKAAIMKEAERTWISSTLACETSALAAATAVLDWHARAEVCESLWAIGAEMREAVSAAIGASGIDGVRVTGIDPMWTIDFESKIRQDRFVALAIAHGVLFKRGAYNFSSLSHEEDAIEAIEYACSRALVDLMEEEQRAAQE
jgi:glutamate-1-semialdehyde aminotransferase